MISLESSSRSSKTVREKTSDCAVRHPGRHHVDRGRLVVVGEEAGLLHAVVGDVVGGAVGPLEDVDIAVVEVDEGIVENATAELSGAQAMESGSTDRRSSESAQVGSRVVDGPEAETAVRADAGDGGAIGGDRDRHSLDFERGDVGDLPAGSVVRRRRGWRRTGYAHCWAVTGASVAASAGDERDGDGGAMAWRTHGLPFR